MVSSSTEMACVGSSHVLNVCSGSSCRARSRIRVQTSVAESMHSLKHVEKPGRRGGEGIGAMWKKQTTLHGGAPYPRAGAASVLEGTARRRLMLIGLCPAAYLGFGSVGGRELLGVFGVKQY